MSIILAILLGILTIFFVVIVIGYNSPKTIILDISRKIAKPADVVFHACGDFKEFVKWSPWSEKDPSMSQSITGEPFTVGSIYTWKGNRSVGSGRMTIDHIEANERIDFTLNFGPQGDIKTYFIIESDKEFSTITWHFESEVGTNPIYRFFGNVMKGYLKKNFSKGLDNLEHYLSAHE